MAKLGGDERVTIRTLASRGVSNREIARQLGVTEGAVRYQLRRFREAAGDGRAEQLPVAAGFREAIDEFLAASGVRSPENVTELHEHLVAEHDYPGSVRNLQRFVKREYPQPAVRARRRVETPPGAQAQADWAHFGRRNQQCNDEGWLTGVDGSMASQRIKPPALRKYATLYIRAIMSSQSAYIRGTETPGGHVDQLPA